MKLICYLSNGFPNLETSVQLASVYADAGCDVIEIDFPAVDPYLEGAFIRERMAASLAACADYNQYMKAIQKVVKNNPKTAVMILTYERTIQTIGPDQFASFCLENGLQDIIYVGTEFPEIRQALVDQGLSIASYVRFHLPKADIDAAKQTNGFIYLQAKPSGEVHPQYPTLKDCLTYLREEEGFNRPIYCGVGISTPEDVAMARQAGADGVFVGSAILKLYEDHDALSTQIKALKAQTK